MAIEARRPWVLRLLTVAFVGLLSLPVARNVDGLPLSTYPMYASARSSDVRFVVVSGVDASGRRSTLSPSEIADTLDPLIAQAFLNDAVGRGDTERVCREIAERVRRDYSEIEIAVEVHDVVDNTRGEESLLDREVRSRCEVAP